MKKNKILFITVLSVLWITSCNKSTCVTCESGLYKIELCDDGWREFSISYGTWDTKVPSYNSRTGPGSDKEDAIKRAKSSGYTCK